MNGPDLARSAGITYRQLDQWCKAGYLQPGGMFGRGHPRTFRQDEINVCRWMARLVRAGFRHDVAARMARGDKQARMEAIAALTDGWLDETRGVA